MELTEFSSNHGNSELVLEPLRDGSDLPPEYMKRVCIGVQRRILRDVLDSSRDPTDQRSGPSKDFTAETSVVLAFIVCSQLQAHDASKKAEPYDLPEVVLDEVLDYSESIHLLERTVVLLHPWV